MNKKNPYNALERIFHEPSRLAIMSALIGHEEGISFGDLKEQCELTDGNLSRHLTSLEEFGAICMEKTFIRKRPRTTISLTDFGREQFMEYLQALEEVLKKAAICLNSTEETTSLVSLPWWKTARI